jgi:hypothetical protein
MGGQWFLEGQEVKNRRINAEDTEIGAQSSRRMWSVGKMELDAMARHYGIGRYFRRKNKGTKKNKGTRSDPTRGLGAAFPLGAAVEPVAPGGEPRGICVEQRRNGEKRRPERR